MSQKFSHRLELSCPRNSRQLAYYYCFCALTKTSCVNLWKRNCCKVLRLISYYKHPMGIQDERTRRLHGFDLIDKSSHCTARRGTR